MMNSGIVCLEQRMEIFQQRLCKKQITARHHRYALRQHLEVVTDLQIEYDLDEHQDYLLQWAQERCSLHLYCVKMQISALSMYTVKKVLKIIQPEFIEELELNTGWIISTLACFAPCLGQMTNLCKLLLTAVNEEVFMLLCMSTDTQHKKVTKFISQFSKLNYLQHLNMVGIYFLSDHLNELFQ